MEAGTASMRWPLAREMEMPRTMMEKMNYGVLVRGGSGLDVGRVGTG